MVNGWSRFMVKVWTCVCVYRVQGLGFTGPGEEEEGWDVESFEILSAIDTLWGVVHGYLAYMTPHHPRTLQ